MDQSEHLSSTVASDPRLSLLQRCCVLLPERGTGFFVGPRTVLTCAHVLQGLNVASTTRLLTRFSSAPMEATVTHLASADWPDVALLDVSAANSPFCVRLGNNMVPGEPLAGRGFPKYGKLHRDDGFYAIWEGNTWQHLADEAAADRLPDRRLVKFKNAHIVGGFSGSPLLNLRTCEVVGIVTESRGSVSALGGWAIPALEVFGVFPELVNIQAKVLRDSVQWQEAVTAAAKLVAHMPGREAFRPAFDRLQNVPSNESVAQGFDQFRYATRSTPFCGRVPELHRLHKFLQAPAVFCWNALCGPGGSGKSRLALHLLDELGARWDGGFIERDDLSDHRWGTWRPILPTLIVVDDADVGAKASRSLAAKLAFRAGEGAWAYPVRLLFVSRNSVFTLESDSDLQAERLRSSREGGDIELPEMGEGECRALVMAMRPAGREDELSGLVRDIEDIDPDRRPLFTQLVCSAALAEGGARPRTWNRPALLRNVLEREALQRWRAAGATEGDRLLLLLGTLCAPLATARLSSQAKHQPLGIRLSKDQRARVAEMLGTTFPDKEVPALKPDILGLMFVLEELEAQNNNDPDKRADCVRLAWRLDAVAMSVSAQRAVEDLTQHPQVASLLDIEIADGYRWEWIQAGSLAVEKRVAGCRGILTRLREQRDYMRKRVEQFIRDYKQFLDATRLEELWRSIATLFLLQADGCRDEDDALWLRAIALPLPTGSLLPGKTFEDVDFDTQVQVDLLAVFATWAMRATNAAQLLHDAHRKAKDRVRARLVRDALANKAARLSADNADNFDARWDAHVDMRRHLLRQRRFDDRYRPSQGGRLLSEGQVKLVRHARAGQVFDGPIELRTDPLVDDTKSLREAFDVYLGHGYMYVENDMRDEAIEFVGNILNALERDLTDPEFEATKQQFMRAANRLKEAAVGLADGEGHASL